MLRAGMQSEDCMHYLVANYPRIVSGLVHPSFLSGLTLLIPCKSLGSSLTHLQFVGSSPPSSALCELQLVEFGNESTSKSDRI